MDTAADLQLRNRRMMGKLLVIALGMLGFAFALVPMYRQICEAIGITQTRAVAPSNTQVVMDRTVTVELLASSAGLPWRFEAVEPVVRLHPGELKTVRYRVMNTLARPVTAHAVMNTAPAVASQFFLNNTFPFPSPLLSSQNLPNLPPKSLINHMSFLFRLG